MSRQLSTASSLDSLKREAKRRLKAIRNGDDRAREWFVALDPDVSGEPTLRDVQRALARDYGFSGWYSLKSALSQRLTSDELPGLTSFLSAAARGDATLVTQALDAEPGLINMRGTVPEHTGQRAALHFGVSHEAVVRVLLERGADPNVRDAGDGATPLHAAAFGNNADTVVALLSSGADPNIRDSKDCDTPASRADRAGHAAIRDRILAANIDLFQAVRFHRLDRVAEIGRRSPWLLNRPFSRYAECESGDTDTVPKSWHTPLAYAAARNDRDSARVLLELAPAPVASPEGRTLVEIAEDAGLVEMAALLAASRRVDESRDGRRTLFFRNACPDHSVRGRSQHVTAIHTAERLLRRDPGLAQENFLSAVVCGDIEAVRRTLSEHPEAANERGGVKGWEPLLYLCFTRLPEIPAAARPNENAPQNRAGAPMLATGENALAIARLLLDHGADPNAYFMAGDSRYTPLVGAIGEGEEDRPPHPQRDGLVKLLLDRGAEPYDIQVLYNIHFHGQAQWFLELAYQRSLVMNRLQDWADPEWHMLHMGGYGTGARYCLDMAIGNNDAAFAEWILAHGATPDPPPPRGSERWKPPQRSVYEEAILRGAVDVARVLERYGAPTTLAGLDATMMATAELHDAAFSLDKARAARVVAEHPELLRSTSVIFAAAKADRPDVIGFLLDLGVPLEIENKERQRPLHAAAWSDAVRAAQFLIGRGADIDPVETSWHNTPLDFAVYGRNQRTMEYLSTVSKDVWNLVFIGEIGRVRDLLREEPSLARLTSDDGSTPLMWLPDDERIAIEMIDLFSANGADLSARTTSGMTALDFARRRGMGRVADHIEGKERR